MLAEGASRMGCRHPTADGKDQDDYGNYGVSSTQGRVLDAVAAGWERDWRKVGL